MTQMGAAAPGAATHRGWTAIVHSPFRDLTSIRFLGQRADDAAIRGARRVISGRRRVNAAAAPSSGRRRTCCGDGAAHEGEVAAASSAVSRQAGLRKGCPGVRTPAVDEPLNRTGARLHHPLILSRPPNIERAFRHRREIWIEFIRCRLFQDTGRSLGRSLQPRRRCSASRACFGLVVDAHRGDAGTDAFTHHAPDRHDPVP
jgi:hypothetical protein